MGLQAERAQLRAGLEAAAQPFAMVGRVELPGASCDGGGANPDVYVLAAADVVRQAVAVKQACLNSLERLARGSTPCNPRGDVVNAPWIARSLTCLRLLPLTSCAWLPSSRAAAHHIVSMALGPRCRSGSFDKHRCRMALVLPS